MIGRFLTIAALHLAALFFMGIAYSSVDETISSADLSLPNTQVLIASLPNS